MFWLFLLTICSSAVAGMGIGVKLQQYAIEKVWEEERVLKRTEKEEEDWGL